MDEPVLHLHTMIATPNLKGATDVSLPLPHNFGLLLDGDVLDWFKELVGQANHKEIFLASIGRMLQQEASRWLEKHFQELIQDTNLSYVSGWSETF